MRDCHIELFEEGATTREDNAAFVDIRNELRRRLMGTFVGRGIKPYA